jgi:large subunit ribosomal protein L32
MPTPKKKTSRSRRDMRRAHDFIVPPGVQQCPNCGALSKPHHVCASCGQYKGREVVTAQA